MFAELMEKEMGDPYWFIKMEIKIFDLYRLCLETYMSGLFLPKAI